ncbi:TetR/AcrR family transcriptional regulator [Saccharibacillus endophyticus]|uniref:TetR family transcriptional regulator n=1 Tax=Saccharibacillus endophyticus TaxID=2060666 RepID=A0ABQ1ZNB7_9BACL|nr:TetR/AcrR family transcriptional regulator [Saccharibacillus endophyticus]GGH69197.1 TetR family transcriptional regulator [Saccharibacillus endophyticus]
MNNEEKNTFAKKQITEAFLHLLNDRELSQITIVQITTEAKVSRNSFYRNYQDKEEILLKHIKHLITRWNAEYDLNNNQSDKEMFGSLFHHLKEKRDFYLLLKKRNLFHLFLSVFVEIYGAKREYDNMGAYAASFIAYGVYGWIEEWIGRGMQESAETMSALLATSGMK